MTRTVLLEINNQIAYVRLNRPEKHNGLNKQMFIELVQTAKAIRRNRDLRCVILLGNGASFCAGLDFAAVSKNPGMIPRFFVRAPWRKANMFQRVAYMWRELPIPVIAVLQGNCFGGGLQIALACDYRIAAADTRLAIMEIKWGLIPDMSGMLTLSALTRMDIAQELTMTGRIFNASEAFDYGLVSKLSDHPLAEAEMLARTICEKSPDAIAAAKYLFKKTWKKDTWSTLFWERITQLRLLGGKNQRIAMKNGLNQENPAQQFMSRQRFK